MSAIYRSICCYPSMLIITGLLAACSGSSGSNSASTESGTVSTALADHPLTDPGAMAFFSDHGLTLQIPDEHAQQERVFAKVASSDPESETVHFLGQISPELSDGDYSIQLTLNLPETVSEVRYQIFSTPEPLPTYEGEVAL